jgi:alkylhydroperoxidase/carboxymuconolactone decarboxylase family protein YurZ
MALSHPFALFVQEASEHATAWMQAAKALGAASASDKKTEELACVAVLAATRNVSGSPFHVNPARGGGAARAARQEVLTSVLLGLPAVESVLIAAVPVALEAYNERAQ